MKIVIIEDEPHTAQDLAGTIVKVAPVAEITTILSSVKESVAWFENNDAPDIIFSDIQLGDGLSFAIFDAIDAGTPVIFCTAYDVYALQAFKAAGIDYVLKPFTEKTIAAALAKYHALKDGFIKSIQSYSTLEKGISDLKRQSAVLVHYKDKILPVKLDDIAVFYLRNDVTYLITFTKEEYFLNETLEEAERLAGSRFYRVNRQCLVNRKTIKDVSKFFGRKLLVNLNISFTEKVTVSKVKASHFLAWLAAE